MCFIGTVAAFETNSGTDIDFKATYWSVWDIDEENDVKVTFEVNEFGDNVQKIYDIRLRVRVEFTTKTYSDSEGTWTINTEGDDIVYTFEFFVDSDDVNYGEEGEVSIRAEFTEDIFLLSDREYDTGWGDVGDVEIEAAPPVFEPPPEPELTPPPEETPSSGFCLGSLLLIVIPLIALPFLKRKK